jgi:predicted metal-binding membrane protein
VVLVAALVAVVAIAWIWIVLGAGTGMSAVAMTGGLGTSGVADMIMEPVAWTPAYAALMLAMWWVMMAAMMLPSAAPMLLLFARVNRAVRAGHRPYVPTGIFAVGYLVAWGGFSALAAGLQWGLEQLGLLSPMMTTTSFWLGGAILVTAGVWQFTPIKGVCLRHCRAPMSFLVQGWRPGPLGARVPSTRRVAAAGGTADFYPTSPLLGHGANGRLGGITGSNYRNLNREGRTD